MFEHSREQIASPVLLADCKIYTFVSFRTCLQYAGMSTRRRYTRLWAFVSHSTGRRHYLNSNNIFSSNINSDSSINSFRSRVTSARRVARVISRRMLCGGILSTSAAKVRDFSVHIAVVGRNNAPTCIHTSSISTWVSKFT